MATNSTDSNDNPDSTDSIDTEQPWQDQGLMSYLYVQRDLSGVQIAEILGCSPSTAYEWLHRHGVDVDSRSDRGYSGEDHHAYNPIDRDVLMKKHHEQGKSMGEIGTELGRHTDVVRKYVNVHDVPPPKPTENDTFHAPSE
jgi:hypothetical protein